MSGHKERKGSSSIDADSGRSSGYNPQPLPALPLGYQTYVHDLSTESWATLMRVNKKRRRMNSDNQGTRSDLFDNSSPRYSWLLDGWLVEERVMPSGRIYRYYYDPFGQMYSSRIAVVAAYEKCGLVVLDVDE